MMRQARNRRNPEAGFSMIELLVVIAIAGILLAAALPAMQSHTGTQKLKQATDEVANTLKLARQRAVATNGAVVVQFDSDNSEFFLFDDRNENGQHDNDETMAGPYEIPTGVALADVGFADGKVTFAAAGSASETEAVVLLGLKQNAQRVDVTAATGLIYVSEIYHYVEGEDGTEVLEGGER